MEYILRTMSMEYWNVFLKISVSTILLFITNHGYLLKTGNHISVTN